MKGNKRRVKRILAGVLALALIAGNSAVLDENSWLDITATADISSTGDVSVDVEFPSTNNDFELLYYDNPTYAQSKYTVTGYRIYFAPNSTFSIESNGASCLTEDSYKHLQDFEDYAIYSFGGGFNSDLVSDITLKNIRNTEKLNNTWGTYDHRFYASPMNISSRVILGDGNAIDFRELFHKDDHPDVSLLNPWSITGEDNGFYTQTQPDLPSIAAWGSTYLSKVAESSTAEVCGMKQGEFYQNFLDNYKRIINEAYGEGYYEASTLPQTVVDMYSSWQLIIEPVVTTIAGGLSAGNTPMELWFGSYYDFVVENTSGATGKYMLTANHVGSIMKNMGKLSNNFPDGVIPETTNGTEYSGWGMYAAYMSILFNSTKANTNIAIYTTEDAKYNSVSGENVPLAIDGKTASTIISDSTFLTSPDLPFDNLTSEAIENTNFNASDIQSSEKFFSFGSKYKDTDIMNIRIGLEDPLQGTDTNTTFQMATGIAPAESGASELSWEDGDKLKGDELGDDYVLRQYQAYKLTYVPTAADKTFSDLYSITTDTSNYEVVYEQVALEGASNSLASGYTFKPVLKRKDTGVRTTLSDFTSNAMSTSALGNGTLEGLVNDGDGDTGKAIYSDITDSSKINNVIGNLTFLGASVSSLPTSIISGSEGKLSALPQTEGVTVEFLTKKQEITSRVATIARDENGSLTYDGSADLKYDISNKGTVTIHTKDLAEGQVGYVIVYPDIASNAENSLFSDGNSNGSSIGNMIDGVDIHGLVGIANLNSVVSKSISNYSVNLVTGGTDYEVNIGGFGDTDGTIKGYNVVFIYDTSVPNSVRSNEAVLQAHRLNYIYPTLLGDSSWNTGVDNNVISVLDDGLIGGIEIYKNSNYAGTLIGQQANLKNILFSDLLRADGSYWSGGLFAPEEVNPKFFDTSSYGGGAGKRVALTHALNLPRTQLGDTVIVSSLNAHNNDIFNIAPNAKSYLETNIASLGIIPNPASTSIAEDTTGTLSTTGFDSFTWSASHGVTVTDAGGNAIEISPYLGSESMTNAGYNLTEKAKKYVPRTKDTAQVDDNLIVNNATKGNSDYTISSVKALNSVLNFYPEVGMLTDIAEVSSNGTLITSPSTTKIYVVGEKKRSLKAASMYTMSVDAVNAFKGTVTSNSKATGSDANKLSNSFGNLPVIYAGADITATVDTDAKLLFSGFVLDIMDVDVDKNVYTGDNDTTLTASTILKDTNLKTAWGTSSFDIASDYKTWVDNIKNNLSVGVGYSTYDKNGNYKKTYNCKSQTLRTTGGNTTLECSYNIRVAKGKIIADATYYKLLEQIMYSYNLSNTDEAEAKFFESGIPQAMIASVESSNDSDNNSDYVNGYKSKWYDEEANYFVIRYYKTSDVQLGNRNGSTYSIICNDKVDISSGPSQSGKLFSNGYLASWEISIYLNKNVNGISGIINNGNNTQAAANATNSTVFMYGMEVNGADFVIPDATTSNM